MNAATLPNGLRVQIIPLLVFVCVLIRLGLEKLPLLLHLEGRRLGIRGCEIPLAQEIHYLLEVAGWQLPVAGNLEALVERPYGLGS